MASQGGQYLPRDHYGAVVVGSGFGGAVAACRLAQAGLEVAILERGRRWPPGSFPRRLGRLGSGWLWGHRHGLYDVGPIGGMLCIRASGWGGGSLVYANVAMRPGPEVFEQVWPQPYRRDVLDPYYDLVAHMLEVTPVQPDPETGRLPVKTTIMEQAARRLGDDAPLFRPNLAIRFADDPRHPGTNRFGIAQAPCVGCARCDIGCNVGAKNTLDLNYLALAERHGATVATLTEVTHVGRAGDGYELHLHQHGDAGEERRTVTADRVFLAAGALGSTEILLRSRDQYATLPDLPVAVGRGYSANGDFLAFGDGTADLAGPGTGPTITTAYGLRTATGDRFFVEDGGYPNEIALMVRGRPTRSTRGAAAGHDMVLLAMGRDRGNGRIRLTRRHRLRVDWDVAANLPLYQAAERACADIVEALGGRAATTWLWRRLRRPVSVHHLGGCAMSTDPHTGVVDVDGEVHGHPGLFVLDGAILPGATGANPSHTIAAVAERCIEAEVRRLTGDTGWVAPERSDVVPVPVPEDHVQRGELPVRAAGPGIMFRETMRGRARVEPPAPAAPAPAAPAAPAAPTPVAPTPAAPAVAASATLAVHIDDLDAFVRDPRHRARVTGRVTLPPLTEPTGASVEGGTLDLLARVGRRQRTMAYVLPFRDRDGRRWELRGHKDVRHRRGLDVWAATTTLHLELLAPSGELDASAGTLRLSPLGFGADLASLRVTGTASAGATARTVGRFGAFFAARLVDVFLHRPTGRRA